MNVQVTAIRRAAISSGLTGAELDGRVDTLSWKLETYSYLFAGSQMGVRGLLGTNTYALGRDDLPVH